MGLESTIVKSRNVHLNKSLIRSLIRLRLQLKGNNLDSLLTASRTLTTATGLQHITGQRNSRIDSSASKSGTQTVNGGTKNSVIQSQSYSTYSTLHHSKGNLKSDNKQNQTREKSNMRAQAKNVLAALFFTSLIMEESYMVNRGKGVLRYDVAQLPSNNPIEDARSEQIIQVPIDDPAKGTVMSDWLFFGVYDGHAGFNTSAKLKKELIASIMEELTKVYPLSDKGDLRLAPDSNTIDLAIRSGFLKMDDEIVNKSVDKLLKLSNINSKAQASDLLMPLLSGSCALVSFYDTNSKILKVAVAGDSRALLGSLNSDNEWTVELLSVDQTGSNPAEVERIRSEHPNEPDLIRRGRILGSLEPSRSFGDARYKWGQAIQDKIYGQFFGRTLPPNLKSPPYVTADPVITTTKIDPAKDKFLVMASDGLYEMLTNEEVVGLVVRWMENEKMINPLEYKASFLSSFLPYDKKRLPKVIELKTTPESPKQAFRRNNTDDVTYLMEDSNVSTHLIRNALSNGGSKEHSEMLASIPSPLSRRYRDDLTVTVVFFGDNGTPNDAGLLEMNLKGTNKKGGNFEPEPKL